MKSTVGRLLAVATGTAAVVRPAPPSRFGPHHPTESPAHVDEVHAVISRRPAAARAVPARPWPAPREGPPSPRLRPSYEDTRPTATTLPETDDVRRAPPPDPPERPEPRPSVARGLTMAARLTAQATPGRRPWSTSPADEPRPARVTSVVGEDGALPGRLDPALPPASPDRTSSPISSLEASQSVHPTPPGPPVAWRDAPRPPDVHVHIGRIVVRAPSTPPVAAQRPRAPGATPARQPLDEYLQRGRRQP